MSTPTPAFKFDFSPYSTSQPRPNPSPSPIPPAQDQTYYFQYVIILVENTLFNIPRHSFEDSPVFNTMFTLPTPPDIPQDGETNDRPLRLHGISTFDFTSLLKVICLKNPFRREPLGYVELVSVLKLATMYEFQDARKMAITSLTAMDVDPINRIELVRAYDLPQWYWPAIRALCERPNRPDDFDVQRLDSDFSMRISELRGQVAGYKMALGGRTVHVDLVVQFIRDIFPREIGDMPAPEESSAAETGLVRRQRGGPRV